MKFLVLFLLPFITLGKDSVTITRYLDPSGAKSSKGLICENKSCHLFNESKVVPVTREEANKLFRRVQNLSEHKTNGRLIYSLSVNYNNKKYKYFITDQSKNIPKNIMDFEKELHQRIVK